MSTSTKVHTKLAEINSRLGNLERGKYQLSIRFKENGNCVLNKMDTHFEHGKISILETFGNLELLCDYLIPFNDGLAFAGLKQWEPTGKKDLSSVDFSDEHIMQIVIRKRKGIDNTEDESAYIKRYLSECTSLGDDQLDCLYELFPCEVAEMPIQNI